MQKMCLTVEHICNSSSCTRQSLSPNVIGSEHVNRSVVDLTNNNLHYFNQLALKN